MSVQKNAASLPSSRTDFTKIRSTEVLEPKWLPPNYLWMQMGHYATYSGTLKWAWDTNLMAPAKVSFMARWSWEINHVMDRSKASGKTSIGTPSVLSYTVYQERTERPVEPPIILQSLFACFFRLPEPILSVTVDTPFGPLPCFRIHKQIEATNHALDYDVQTSILVGVEVETLDGTPVYSCLLSETNIDALIARRKVDVRIDEPLPPSNYQKALTRWSAFPWWRRVVSRRPDKRNF